MNRRLSGSLTAGVLLCAALLAGGCSSAGPAGWATDPCEGNLAGPVPGRGSVRHSVGVDLRGGRLIYGELLLVQDSAIVISTTQDLPDSALAGHSAEIVCLPSREIVRIRPGGGRGTVSWTLFGFTAGGSLSAGLSPRGRTEDPDAIDVAIRRNVSSGLIGPFSGAVLGAGLSYGAPAEAVEGDFTARTKREELRPLARYPFGAPAFLFPAVK